MSILNSVVNNATEPAVEDDFLGSGRKIYDTDAYPAKVDLAYAFVSPKGAIGVHLAFSIKANDKMEKYTEEIYFTNQKKETTYFRDGKNHPLPGFLRLNSISQLLVGKDIDKLASETKMVSRYNSESKKEEPVEVSLLTELSDKQLFLGLSHIKENKRTNVNGKWLRTAEVIEKNEIGKIFNVDKLSHAEVVAGETAPNFYNRWIEKFQGKVEDKVKDAEVASASAPAASPFAPAATTSPLAATTEAATPTEPAAPAAPAASIFD